MVPSDARVPILTYHSIDDSGSVISTPPDVFRAQMQSLAARGYNGISLDSLLAAWSGDEQLPSLPVVLTFDDAYENVATHAVPLLLELKFNATIFAVSEKLGGTNDWSDQSADIPRMNLLSASALMELSAHDFEIGAHSATHRKLSALSINESTREIVDCKRTLEDKIGSEISTFAYPFGDTSSAVESLVSQHYRGAVNTLMRSASPRDLRWSLPRIDTYYVRHAALFNMFGTSAGDVYLRARAGGRALKKMFGK